VFKFSIGISGDKEVALLLNGISENVKNFRPAFEKMVGDVIIPAIRWQFESEGRRGGTPWGPYNAAEVKSGYVGMKKKFLGRARPILRWKGGRERLYPSFVQRDAEGHVEHVTATSLRVGSRIEYAAKHHFGRGSGWKGKYPLPKRPIIKLTRNDIQALGRTAQVWARYGKFDGLGLRVRSLKAVR